MLLPLHAGHKKKKGDHRIVIVFVEFEYLTILLFELIVRYIPFNYVSVKFSLRIMNDINSYTCKTVVNLHMI
jgi:hypothetical protein